MDLLTSSCRRALQRSHAVPRCSRRTFLSVDVFYDWSSPVSFFKKPPTENPIELPSGIKTLDPRRFTDAQYFDISQSPFRMHFRKMKAMQLPDPHGRQHGNQIATSNTPFPPNTRGFLYFRSVPNQNPLGGSVRFRVAEKPDKEGFLTGHDLLMSHGLPWQLPIWEVVWRPAYHGILDVLTADGFAPPLLKQACMSLNVARDSVFITALGDPWAVDWSKEFSRVYFVRPLHSPVAALVRHPWYSRNASRNAPYTGRGLVSVIKMPDGELGLRIDKVLTLQRHAMNLKTVLPVEGLVTPFLSRLIHKSTKVSEEQMDKQVNHVTFPVSQLPLAPANPNPFDIYHHEVHTLADVRRSPNHPPTKAKDPPAHKPMPGHFCVQPPSPSRAANSEAQNPAWDAVSRSLPPINNTSQTPWDASPLSLASDARSTVPPPPRPTESS